MSDQHKIKRNCTEENTRMTSSFEKESCGEEQAVLEYKVVAVFKVPGRNKSRKVNWVLIGLFHTTEIEIVKILTRMCHPI